MLSAQILPVMQEGVEYGLLQHPSAGRAISGATRLWQVNLETVLPQAVNARVECVATWGAEASSERMICDASGTFFLLARTITLTVRAQRLIPAAAWADVQASIRAYVTEAVSRDNDCTLSTWVTVPLHGNLFLPIPAWARSVRILGTIPMQLVLHQIGGVGATNLISEDLGVEETPVSRWHRLLPQAQRLRIENLSVVAAPTPIVQWEMDP